MAPNGMLSCSSAGVMRKIHASASAARPAMNASSVATRSFQRSPRCDRATANKLTPSAT